VYKYEAIRESSPQDLGLLKHIFVEMYPYEVATMSRLLKIIGLLCKRALYKRLYSAKEPYDFKEPTNRSHPTWRYIPIHIIRSQKWRCTWTSLSPQARHHWDGIIGRYGMMRRLRRQRCFQIWPHVTRNYMGCLQSVGSWKLHVSSENIGLFCRALLQKRPIILRSLLIVAPL